MSNILNTKPGMLYLVIDPAPGLTTVIPQVEKALLGGVDILQVWNHWSPDVDPQAFLEALLAMASRYHVPVLIHEAWAWLKTFPQLAGVHFDDIPQHLDTVRAEVGRNFLVGITCGNDMTRLSWAIDHRVSYLSFCAMFPSASAGSCELVSPATVADTRGRTDLPIFVSGGITPERISSLRTLGITGVAVISGILKAPDPAAAARQYKDQLNSISQHQLNI